MDVAGRGRGGYHQTKGGVENMKGKGGKARGVEKKDSSPADSGNWSDKGRGGRRREKGNELNNRQHKKTQSLQAKQL